MYIDCYIVLCNGCRLLLKFINICGEYVVGICFRVWYFVLVFYLIIGVYVLLVFDVYDSWVGCLLGGFIYYVSYLGGCNFFIMLVNVFEVEGRCIVRFWDYGYILLVVLFFMFEWLFYFVI